MEPKDLSLSEKGDDVMKQTGILKEATDLLKDLSRKDQDDKEEIGSWLTVVGRALLAIFK